MSIFLRCNVTNGIRDCNCNDGYIGDGRHECRIPKRDCNDLLVYHNVTQSGIYGEQLGIWAGAQLDRAVRCDMDANTGNFFSLFDRLLDVQSINQFASYSLTSVLRALYACGKVSGLVEHIVFIPCSFTVVS